MIAGAPPRDTTTAPPVLRAEGVSKSYGQTPALDGVSLAIAPGEFVALLGPNGAGKTTLFQLLTGLFVPDAGEIEVDGANLRRSAVGALASLGVVFQQPTLDLDLGVAANLLFHARLHGLRGVRGRITEALERVGLAAQARTLARALSGGNRRRVELARALLHEPKVLLMDEPTVGLDPESRQNVLDFVHRQCRERAMATLWATHLVDEAEGADRVVILHRGRILADAPANDVIATSGAERLAEAFLAMTGATQREE